MEQNELDDLDGELSAAPTKFAAAYAELLEIAAELKPAAGKIPDVDAIEPLVRRAQVLARYCMARIDAVRKLLEGSEFLSIG